MDLFDNGSIERNQLTSPSLLLKLVHLGINFIPVLSTAGLAAVSGWYRNTILFDALYLYGLILTLTFL